MGKTRSGVGAILLLQQRFAEPTLFSKYEPRGVRSDIWSAALARCCGTRAPIDLCTASKHPNLSRGTERCILLSRAQRRGFAVSPGVQAALQMFGLCDSTESQKWGGFQEQAVAAHLRLLSFSNTPKIDSAVFHLKLCVFKHMAKRRDTCKGLCMRSVQHLLPKYILGERQEAPKTANITRLIINIFSFYTSQLKSMQSLGIFGGLSIMSKIISQADGVHLGLPSSKENILQHR